MEAVYQQIQYQTRRSMKKKLQSTFEKETLSTEDKAWLKNLLNELQWRVVGLAPSRPDLEREFLKAFDVQLLSQMIDHDAWDLDDIKKAGEALFEHLLRFTPPSYTAAVNKILADMKDRPCVGTLIYEAHIIIDEIYRLAAIAQRCYAVLQSPSQP